MSSVGARSKQVTKAALLLASVDLAAVVLFATEGAAQAVFHHLDVFGVVVLAIATALAGGITRDVLLGDVPPATLRVFRYTLAATAAGLVVFCLRSQVNRLDSDVIAVLDAAGLALFTVSGATKALLTNANTATAVILGVMTGVGGGVVRDVLLNEVPAILQSSVYAVAALLGATVVALGVRGGAPLKPMMAAGAAACFALRVAAIYGHWNLPTA